MEFGIEKNSEDYVSDLNINTDINTDIELDLYNITETREKLNKIKSDIEKEIKKILILEKFPCYFDYNIDDYICSEFSRENNIEYMNNEKISLIGCKVGNIYLNTRYRTIKEGVIIRENEDNTIDVKPIDCEIYNHDEKKREIVLYDLNKDDFMTGKEEQKEEEEQTEKEEQIEEEDEEVYKPFFYRNKLVESINDDGSITYSKLQIELINGCLPRTLETNERRFIVSLLPVQKSWFTIHYNYKYGTTSSGFYMVKDLKFERIERYYVLDKKLNIQYDLNGIDIFELLKRNDEMIPYFEKYEKDNEERNNQSENTIELKNKLIKLFRKANKIKKIINELPRLKLEQGKKYSSSGRTERLKAEMLKSELLKKLESNI